jgi:hypothetical protein
MRTTCLALGFFVTLLACGRSSPARRDAASNSAGDAAPFVDGDWPAGAGGVLPGGTGAVAGGSGGGQGGGHAGAAGDAVSTGGGNGDGGEGSGGQENCGVQTAHTVRMPSEVLLVLDRSGSMVNSIAEDCSCGSGAADGTVPCADTVTCQDRWSTLSAATMATVRSAPDVYWGLKLFPTPGGAACDVSAQVEVPIAPHTAGAIEQVIASTTPANSTPTAQAVRAAVAYLKSVADPNRKYILLATDGQPNCGPGSSTSTTNVDGTRAEIAAAFLAGFPVYVIGIGPSVGNLDDLAAAGGTGRSYSATSASDLTNALSSISRLVASCTFSLAYPPPDPQNVVVYFNRILVPRDDVNGWSYGGDGHSVVLNGDACANLMASLDATVTVLFGCPGVPSPPRLP